MTITVGLDPGINGAVAAIQDGTKIVMLEDMPTLSSKKGTKVSRSVDAVGLSKMISSLLQRHPGEYIACVIEKTSAMPGQGVTSMYSMGHSRGVAEGVLLSKGLPTQLVPPATWKRSMGFSSDKEFIRGEMQRRFPDAEIHLKKHTDRAEAIALAYYLHTKEYL